MAINFLYDEAIEGLEKEVRDLREKREKIRMGHYNDASLRDALCQVMSVCEGLLDGQAQIIKDRRDNPDDGIMTLG